MEAIPISILEMLRSETHALSEKKPTGKIALAKKKRQPMAADVLLVSANLSLLVTSQREPYFIVPTSFPGAGRRSQ